MQGHRREMHTGSQLAATAAAAAVCVQVQRVLQDVAPERLRLVVAARSIVVLAAARSFIYFADAPPIFSVDGRALLPSRGMCTLCTTYSATTGATSTAGVHFCWRPFIAQKKNEP